MLVVDIGGGTTDCSMLLMGPAWHRKKERHDSLLGHSGCRTGGNDLDIQLAFKQFMPLLGMNGMTEKGIALPTLPWWNAVAINDVPAQSAFYNNATRTLINEMIRDAREPAQVKRLLSVWQQRLSYRLVQQAEACKIALSDKPLTYAALAFIETALETRVSAEEMVQAIAQPVSQIQTQIRQALDDSGTRPDVVYLTGGSARSPQLRLAVQQTLPDVTIASGDDFGSVAAGLARWAELLFPR